MASEQRVEMSIPADVRYLNVVGAAIGAMMEHLKIEGDKSTVSYEVQLAVHEVCTNIIEHAYKYDTSKTVRVDMVLASMSTFVVQLYDTSGIRFDASDVDEPDVAGLQEGGMGLMLVKKIMDDVAYTHENKVNCWRLTKQF